MNHESHDNQPKSLFELGWIYALGAMFAFDSGSGQLIDVNPAAEFLAGYSREELLGLHIAQLHPEEERQRAKAQFLKAEHEPSRHDGFHIQRKNGQILPVSITSSERLVLDGRSVVLFVYCDVTEAQQNEHRLATKKWALSAYAGVAMALWHRHTPESLLEAICKAITQESVYLLAWVGIAEDGPDKPVRVAAAAGSAIGYLDGLHMSWEADDPWGQGPTGTCIRTRQVQIVENTETSPQYLPWIDQARRYGLLSSVSIPFASNGSARGALVVYAARANAFEAVAIDVFAHLAEQIGYGMHAIEQEQLLHSERLRVAKMETQLTEALSAMVAPIVLAMEMRDPYTAGHQSRVAEIAVAMGRELNWPEEKLHGLRVAALVHDIGKISIPAEILTKPGKLNAAERAMIDGHSDTGYFILKDIPFPWPIAEIVRQHHEKLDGSGYPLGLTADAILPESKLLAVADIVEAMTAYRPYRRGMDLSVVLNEIESQAGTLLDAEAVRICTTLFREKRLVLPNLG